MPSRQLTKGCSNSQMGLYGTVQAALPEFYKNGKNGAGRIVVISPPIYSRFLRGKTAYAMGKWGMSALTMGLPFDWEREGRSEMAITSLWPAAVSLACNLGGQRVCTLTRPRLLSRRLRRTRTLAVRNCANQTSSQTPSWRSSKLRRRMSAAGHFSTKTSFESEGTPISASMRS